MYKKTPILSYLCYFERRRRNVISNHFHLFWWAEEHTFSQEPEKKGADGYGRFAFFSIGTHMYEFLLP